MNINRANLVPIGTDDQTHWIPKVFMKKQFLSETNVPFFVSKMAIISTISCLSLHTGRLNFTIIDSKGDMI